MYDGLIGLFLPLPPVHCHNFHITPTNDDNDYDYDDEFHILL